MKRTIFAAATATILATTAFADNSMSKNPMVGGAEMFADKNIVENAVNSADHTTLVAAVQAAGLVETLSGEGPFTVFAPTNDAFAALPEGTVETLLKPENKDQLTKILTCHVVAADVMSEALVGMIEDDGGMYDVPTVGGCTLKAMVKDGMVMIEDEQGNAATVTIADVDQSNGVIHVIDKVLLPAM
ncbi:fasciclin domain-containing protein [Celeribacter sp.]|uniref:fasciclin domain-containing protein n=1 Tax=Celeribacter sp. TaxID=1890673 RepID=UPI003A8C9A27